MIFETKPAITSRIMSICPSCDGHRILMGSYSGIMGIWDVNLIRNHIATIKTQDDVWKIIVILLSKKIVDTTSEQSIELWNIVTLEIIRHIDNESGMKIVFFAK